MGYRGRRRGYYPGNGPFRDLSPWERPGWAYGSPDVENDQWSCARFPWLPRRWWMDQRFVGAKSPPEKESLEKQAQILESQLEMIRKRIGELPVIEKQE